MSPSYSFETAVRLALANGTLQKALGGLEGGLVARRAACIAALPEFEALRDEGRTIRESALNSLDTHLETFERNARAAGSTIHWATDAAEACCIITSLLKSKNAHRVTKGKSMVSEEIGLNAHLESKGFEIIETDLGEYILQLRNETPSHIIAPAIHLTQADVEADFRRHHTQFPQHRNLDEAGTLVAEARAVLREKFLSADAGITGANFLIAETGSTVLVTNEGNGDLTQTLPKLHIVLASIDKVVPTLAETVTLLRLLARSATGQDMTAYTTFTTGPKRSGDLDGPDECHIVIVDNGRSDILGSAYRDVLRCIRCGACQNHCPVYKNIGGHAYGSVYAGPIGAALTPALAGLKDNRDLPNASSFCGRCEQVCPVKIPLVTLMRQWREQDFSSASAPSFQRRALSLWGAFARRPKLYHLIARFGAACLGCFGRNGSLRRLPFLKSWTASRDIPAPQGRTFQQLWVETQRGVPR